MMKTDASHSHFVETQLPRTRGQEETGNRKGDSSEAQISTRRLSPIFFLSKQPLHRRGRKKNRKRN
jgi:hypothetical protein